MNIQKEKFSLPQDLIYLNMAYMSPLLKKAEEKGIEGLKLKKNPAKLGMKEFFHDVSRLRQTCAKLIHADAQQIAIIPSVSYGMANAAKNLNYKENGEIICLDEQFPSNYYPWEQAAKENDQQIKFVKSTSKAARRVEDWNREILKSINPKTTAVCLAHVHWADGSLFDLKSISDACKANNAYLIIDGTQSVGALALYLDDVPFDVLVVGGYKWLLGHYGLGFAYYSPSFNQGIPIEDNWINKENSEDFKALVEYKDNFKSGAARYSVGEQSNFIHIPILQAGLDQILDWGLENIQDYCKTLHLLLISLLSESPYEVQGLKESSSHLTGIRVKEGMDMKIIEEALKANNIFVSYRGDAIRISFYVFNSEEDVKKLCEVLLNIL